jgi:hypothetical protein
LERHRKGKAAQKGINSTCAPGNREEEPAMNDDSHSRLEGGLLTAAVMQCSVFDFQEAVEELNREVSLMRRINHSSLELLKAFSDLYLELSEKAAERECMERTLRRIEREAASTRLPLWFWRPEEGLGIKEQLLGRARFLIHDMKYGRDDV